MTGDRTLGQALHESEHLKAGGIFATHNQMIMHDDINGLGYLYYRLRERYVLGRGRWIAGRVIMYEDNGGGFVDQRAANDFAGINRGAVDRSMAHDLIREQTVFAVQKQNAKLLSPFKLHRGAAIIQQGIPIGQERAVNDRAFANTNTNLL